MAESTKKSAVTDAKLDDLTKKFDVLLEKMLPTQPGVLGSTPVVHPSAVDVPSCRKWGDHMSPNMMMERPKHHHYNSKIEFPYFDGTSVDDPYSWLYRCERYYDYKHITNPIPKLDKAVLHLTGRAESWYFSYQLSRGGVTWQEFSEELCKSPTIPEEFFVKFFMEGLKKEIRHTVKMLNPYTLSQAVEKARHQEKVMESLIKKNRNGWGRGTWKTNSLQIPNSNLVQTNKGARANGTTQSNKLFELQKAQGLCYRCHIITQEGEATDPAKVEVMESWPLPKTIKALRGFLSLRGYYRRLIRSYETISRPLTNLLKKNAFHWDTSVDTAFLLLKQAMISAPVIALTNFSKEVSLSYDLDPVAPQLLTELITLPGSKPHYLLSQGFIWILQRIGTIAYHLEFPAGSIIHHVFDVSQLKCCIGPSVVLHRQALIYDDEGLVIVQPLAILQCCIVKENNIAAVKVLVCWTNFSPEEETWAD
ncbi:hypothetical protein CQW23_08667 [Capsicum baccatum]|uniref:Mitochondrial protein n=1 Tax=Capsicum baccatum TaxID=33114 RepID=A0A2G2X9N7_CAPBA|nr:hypothetical protein CQW23_08667 [Capsicum baccatum]